MPLVQIALLKNRLFPSKIEFLKKHLLQHQGIATFKKSTRKDMSYIYKQFYGEKDWKGRLKELTEAFSYRSYNGTHKQKVSHETKHKRKHVLFLAFRELREDGYKISDPLNLKPKHIEHLVDRWVAAELSASTITNRISILNLFTVFIGKPGMVKAPEDYVDDKLIIKRSFVNKEDKSWSAKDVDPVAIAAKASAIDIYTGVHVDLMITFGLRVKEAMSLKPYKSDYGQHLLVMDGTKGGRTRIVHIDTEHKRQLIDKCKQLCGKVEKNMCHPDRSLVQEKNRLYYVMRKCDITKEQLGLTPHGLRHQYLNDRYEEIAGHPSPVRGGEIVDKEKDQEARLMTMLEAGHGRTKIGAAYYGSAIAQNKVNDKI